MERWSCLTQSKRVCLCVCVHVCLCVPGSRAAEGRDGSRAQTRQRPRWGALSSCSPSPRLTKLGPSPGMTGQEKPGQTPQSGREAGLGASNQGNCLPSTTGSSAAPPKLSFLTLGVASLAPGSSRGWGSGVEVGGKVPLSLV